MSMRSLRRSMLPAPTTVAPGVSTTVPRVVAMPCLMSKWPAMQEMLEPSPPNGVSRPNRLDSSRRAKLLRTWPSPVAKPALPFSPAIRSRSDVPGPFTSMFMLTRPTVSTSSRPIMLSSGADWMPLGVQLQREHGAVLARLQRPVAVDRAAFDMRLDVFQRRRAVFDMASANATSLRAGPAAHQGADRPGELAVDVLQPVERPGLRREQPAVAVGAGWCRRHRRARDP